MLRKHVLNMAGLLAIMVGTISLVSLLIRF
jgi:hypothetical protein